MRRLRIALGDSHTFTRLQMAMVELAGRWDIYFIVWELANTHYQHHNYSTYCMAGAVMLMAELNISERYKRLMSNSWYMAAPSAQNFNTYWRLGA